MADNIFRDENAYAEFNFAKADSVVELHAKYIRTPLSDVDFIIETADRILLIEYKNSKIPNA